MKRLFRKSTLLVILCFSGILTIGYAQGTSSNTATVYILRETELEPSAKFPILVNNMQIGDIKAKQYFECLIPSGRVSISTAISSKQKEKNELNFKVESGKSYYVMLNIESEAVGVDTIKKDRGTLANAFVTFFGNSSNKKILYEHTASLARMSDGPGSKLLTKFKLQEFVDLTDDYELAPLDKGNFLIAKQNTEGFSKQPRDSDVDINIPVTNTKAENTFVLIIANENYEFIDDVQFALNDGETFKDYCIKTLGVPERQVWFYKNASAGIMAGGVDKMVQAMNIFDNAKAIVYYCGHGIPDEKTGDAYIVPIDGNGTNTTTCYSLNKLYKTLSASKAISVTYFMDACFTGANRDGSMLVAARGVAREAKKETLNGNSIVFSAASGDETAMPFKEKRHGLFTYFLLKKLKETKGNVSYGELADYIQKNVKKESFLTNEKPQNPVIATSEQMSGSWKTTKLK